MMSDDGLRKILDEMIPSDREYPTPQEDTLSRYIESYFEGMSETEDTMHFAPYIEKGDVISWLSENRPEFMVAAIKDPAAVDGSEEVNSAFEALGYMEPWYDYDGDPETLDKKEYIRWQDWDNARDAAGRDDQRNDEF